MADSHTGDLGAIKADIRHIRDALKRIEAKVDDINGSVDGVAMDVAVLNDWRKTHRETHSDLDGRVKRNAILNGSATGALGALAAFLGLKNG
jgi:hypothetical protein